VILLLRILCAERRWCVPTEPETSPFAGIAPPEPSAVEQWQQRQAQARRTRRLVIGALSCAVVSSALATTIGICIQEGIRALLAVLVASFLGAVAGLLVGVLLGCACFALMSMSGTGHRPTLESKMAQRDPMSVIAVLVVAWGLFGVLIGSAGGGLAGAAWFLDGGTPSADFPGAILGALVGVALAGIGWLVLSRRSRRNESALNQSPGQGA
jgi:hypothetical protein